MDPERFETLLSLFKILADDTRLRMVGMLAEKPCSVDELAGRLKLKAPTVSHHLKRLKQVNLVSMERDQNTHLYRFEADALQAVSKDILSLETVAAPEDQQTRVSWQEKVLQTFIVEGKLVKIPGSRKKREVILNWLVQQFEQGRQYPEKEVNAILRNFHEDVATLRREMIGYHLLARESQVYWRREQT